MTSASVHVDNVCKSYGPKAVLKHLNLSLWPGEIYGMLGSNGSGKSTLLRIIAGRYVRRVEASRLPEPPASPSLTAEQDQLIQDGLLRRDGWIGNALLLLRNTGMRIGECLDLPLDCLRRIGQDQWAVHLPLGKLRTERLVPVDDFVCGIVHRLRLLRSQDALAADAGVSRVAMLFTSARPIVVKEVAGTLCAENVDLSST